MVHFEGNQNDPNPFVDEAGIYTITTTNLLNGCTSAADEAEDALPHGGGLHGHAGQGVVAQRQMAEDVHAGSSSHSDLDQVMSTFLPDPSSPHSIQCLV